MILRTGDLFTTDALVLGHGVNTVGVMGAGIAAQFARRFPGMERHYAEQCRTGALEPGGMLLWRCTNGRAVANMASQDNPGPCARIEWLASAAALALDFATTLPDTRVAIPRIGCGIGGLEWDEVEACLRQVERNRMAQFEVWS